MGSYMASYNASRRRVPGLATSDEWRMARDKLTALQVKRVHDQGEAVLLADGAGLYLRKQTSAGTTWTFRYRLGGRDRRMALGNLCAKWSEFDLDGTTDSGPLWRLPASRTKTAAPLSVPLAPAVVGWLKSLREISSGSEYVFPKRRRDHRQRALHVGIDTLNAALAAVDHGLEAFTIHDLRRTMRTHLSALGVRTEFAERCLNHKLPGIQSAYNTHDYFLERRAALESWTTLLLEIERGERKVTALKSRSASA